MSLASSTTELDRPWLARGALRPRCPPPRQNRGLPSQGCTPSVSRSCTQASMARACGELERTADWNALASCGRSLTLGPGSCQCRSSWILAATGRCPPFFPEVTGLDLLAEPPAVASLVMTKSIWVLDLPCTNVWAGEACQVLPLHGGHGGKRVNSGSSGRASNGSKKLGPTSLGHLET